MGVIIFEDKKELVEVVKEFSNAVTSTMGPGGRNVIIHSDDGVPTVTKDGVTVAENIFFSDPFANTIVNLLKEAARKTNSDVGDGTTTSTLLSEYLISRGIEDTTGENVVSLKDYIYGMEEGILKIIDYLQDSTTLVDGNMLEAVVKISSNNDKEIIDLIMRAIDKVGVDGMIHIKPHQDVVSGIKSNNGAHIDSRVFVDTKGEEEAVKVLLVEGPLLNTYDITSFLKLANIDRMPIVLIAKEFGDPVLRAIQVNNARGNINVIPVEAEGFATFRMELLKDIRNIVGGTILSSDGSTERSIKDVVPEDLGYVDRIIYNKNEITLIPDESLDTSQFASLVKTLKKELEVAKRDISTANANHIKRRLAKYSGVATILVGGYTDAEVSEKVDRVEDAISSVAAAVKGGVLPGGGSSLLNSVRAVNTISSEGKTEDFIKGIKCIADMCYQPIMKLAQNAGILDISNEVSELIGKEDKVLNMNNFMIEDAFESGVLDPTLVTINSIQNAFSVAKTIIKSSVVIVPEDYNGSL
jgi:chaperonin GroEL